MTAWRASWHYLALLARLRLRLLLRPRPEQDDRLGRTSPQDRMLLITIGLAGFLLVISIPLARIMERVVDVPAGCALLDALLAWASSWVAVVQVLFAIPIVLGALLSRENDLPLLLMTPLSPRLIMAEKLLAMLGGGTLLQLIVGCAVLFNLGTALDLGIGYYPAALVILLLLPVGPFALALTLVVAVLRWIPPARVRNIATILGALVGIGVYLGLQLLPRRDLVDSSDIRTSLERETSAWWQVLPTAWAGRGLSAIGQGHNVEGLVYLGGWMLLTLGLAVVAVGVAGHLFATGWASYQEVARPRHMSLARSRSARVAGRVAPDSRASRWRPVWWPLVGKEWRTLRRDPQIWTGLLFPLTMVGYWFYRDIAGPGRPSGSGDVGFGSVSYIVFPALAANFLLGPLALTIVNREGRSIELLALAPLTARDILLGKWVFCVLPTLLLVEAMVGAGPVLFGVSPVRAIFVGLALAALAIALAGIALVSTLTWPKLDWENPQRARSTPAGLAAAVVGFGFSGVVCLLLFLVLALADNHPIPALLAGLAAAALIGLVAIACLHVGTRRMARLLDSLR